MSELSIDSLKDALNRSAPPKKDDRASLFETTARNYEKAVRQLIDAINSVVKQIPQLTVSLEDENEEFTSPAFPGMKTTITDQRLRITREDNFVLFDPKAEALLCALGQIKVITSKPIPSMVENVLYLDRDTSGSGTYYWGYRSTTQLGGQLETFNQTALLKLLHHVFV